MKYFKFTTQEEAEAKVQEINDVLGFPVSPDAVTRTYCEAEQVDDWFGIMVDDATSQYIDNEIVDYSPDMVE
jgi:hypothetical protein